MRWILPPLSQQFFDMDTVEEARRSARLWHCEFKLQPISDELIASDHPLRNLSSLSFLPKLHGGSYGYTTTMQSPNMLTKFESKSSRAKGIAFHPRFDAQGSCLSKIEHILNEIQEAMDSCVSSFGE